MMGVFFKVLYVILFDLFFDVGEVGLTLLTCVVVRDTCLRFTAYYARVARTGFGSHSIRYGGR